MICQELLNVHQSSQPENDDMEKHIAIIAY